MEVFYGTGILALRLGGRYAALNESGRQSDQSGLVLYGERQLITVAIAGICRERPIDSIQQELISNCIGDCLHADALFANLLHKHGELVDFFL